jgi:hypothetical protein
MLGCLATGTVMKGKVNKKNFSCFPFRLVISIPQYNDNYVNTQINRMTKL